MKNQSLVSSFPISILLIWFSCLIVPAKTFSMRFNRRDIAGTLILLMILKGMLRMILYCEHYYRFITFYFNTILNLRKNSKNITRNLYFSPICLSFLPLSLFFFICVIYNTHMQIRTLHTHTCTQTHFFGNYMRTR